MIRIFKLFLVLTPTLALAAAAAWFLSKPSSVVPNGDPAAADGGRLVVLVVFDQMRGDYLERFSPAFSSDGFERLKREGVWYSNVMLPYACSATSPGHASLSTGANPRVHGIIENEWYDRARATRAYSAADGERVYPRVPTNNNAGGPGMAPTRILAPTLSEALKNGTNGQGRLFSVSLKARAAVLLGGKECAGAYCFDNGDFHTSTFYRPTVPAWVEQFNTSGAANAWAGKEWAKTSKADYETLVGNQPTKLPRTLPASGAEYYAALEASAFGNDLLWQFAKAAISAEKLGNNGTSDVLCLSFSANDIIGHTYGPDSQEVLDTTLRSDALLAEMVKHLDDTLGRDKYTLIVTADHGVGPRPDNAARTHASAAQITDTDLVAGLDDALDEAFGTLDGSPGRWTEGDFRLTKPWIYLNRRRIEAVGVPYATVEAYAAKWLANRDHVQTAYTRSKLTDGVCLPEEKAMFDAVVNAFHPERSGDVFIVVKPYVQVTGRGSTYVDHGSVHDYDRRVFVMAIGAKVPKQGPRTAPMTWLSIPAMMSKCLGIEPPAKALKSVPDGW